MTTRLKLDCAACKTEKSMAKTKVARFPLFIQFIGGLIAVPSFLGMLAGGIAVARSIAAVHNGVEIGAGSVFGMAIIATSAIGGLIGWLLVMRKKVYKCTSCGYILDRA